MASAQDQEFGFALDGGNIVTGFESYDQAMNAASVWQRGMGPEIVLTVGPVTRATDWKRGSVPVQPNAE